MDSHSDDPLQLPVTDVFDLHSVSPRDSKGAVEAYLEAAHAKGYRYLRIVHGRGIGVQREMVRTVLSRTPFVRAYGDAPAEAGGWGATLVELGEPLMDELESLAKQYDDALAEVESIAGTLRPEQIHWCPAPDKWCVGQCLEHLTQVGTTYAGKISSTVEVGTKEHVFASGPFTYGWLDRLFLRLTEPPPKFRVKAPRVFRPKPVSGRPQDPASILDAYRKSNRQLRELVLRSKGLDRKRLKVASPASDLIQVPLGIALAIAVAHERRHIYQMKEILRAAGPALSPR